MSSNSRKRQRKEPNNSRGKTSSPTTSTSSSSVGPPDNKLLKKRADESDLICPLCFDMFESVQVTQCGHSFCRSCIERSLAQTPSCPVCCTPLAPQGSYSPNFSLNDIVAKAKLQTSMPPPKVTDVFKLSKELDSSDLKTLNSLITAEVNQDDKRKDVVQHKLHAKYLSEMKRRKKRAVEELQRQLSIIEQDEEKVIQQLSATTVPLGEDEFSKYRMMELNLFSHFDDLDQCYFQMAEEDTPPHSVSSDSLPLVVPSLSQNTTPTDETTPSDQATPIDETPPNQTTDSTSFETTPIKSNHSEIFGETLMDVTQFSSFQELATLHYGDGPIGTSSIVSSIEFDNDGDFFAVGGVTKKVKIYDYHNVVSEKRLFATIHYPVRELPCNAKISSVAYSPYVKCQLSTSDYDGTVTVWDSNYSTCTHNYQEHQKRVWSVTYNHYDPSLLATGGDDCSLKLWHLSMGHSVQTQPTHANVCSVKFQPGSKYLLAYGSADHIIRLVDIRKFSEPLVSCLGHKKAVSYVQFLNDKELVSASTDSELRLWSVETGSCLRTYRGHTNDKNFVGLSVNNGYITCGSENNSFYMYHKYVSKPVLNYKFHIHKNILPGVTEQKSDDGTDFVSAVCSRKNSTSIVAANSQGFIKVLRMI